MRKKWKKWKIWHTIKNYLVQLSVVVLGIFITFGISDYIKEKQERKEFRQLIFFLKTELENNLSYLQKNRRDFEYMRRGTELIYQVKGECRKLPLDTLKTYYNLPLYYSSFAYNQYAMDLIRDKASSQSFSSPELLFNLLDCYVSLQSYKENVERYTQKIYDSLSDIRVDFIYNYAENNDILGHWEYLMKFQGVRNRMLDFGNLKDYIRQAENNEKKIGEVLAKLEKELKEES